MRSNDHAVRWKLIHADSYCTGAKKSFVDQNGNNIGGPGTSIQACQGIVSNDFACSNIMYGNGDLCRCVPLGDTCTLRDSSKSHNNVYEYQCCDDSSFSDSQGRTCADWAASMADGHPYGQHGGPDLAAATDACPRALTWCTDEDPIGHGGSRRMLVRQLQDGCDQASIDASTQEIQSICCNEPGACVDSSPITCNADCAAVYLPFYTECLSASEESGSRADQNIDDVANLCIEQNPSFRASSSDGHVASGTSVADVLHPPSGSDCCTPVKPMASQCNSLVGATIPTLKAIVHCSANLAYSMSCPAYEQSDWYAKCCAGGRCDSGLPPNRCTEACARRFLPYLVDCTASLSTWAAHGNQLAGFAARCVKALPTDACGILNGDGSICSDVCGIPNGAGTSCLDKCGVPFGDDSSCADECGVPNGDGRSCDPCYENHRLIDCGLHGKCVTDGICTCNLGYTGSKCDVVGDKCAAIDCGTHGICANGRCLCQNADGTENGYTGKNCEVAPDLCMWPIPVQCGSHGTCCDGQCVCCDGWTGIHCQHNSGHGSDSGCRPTCGSTDSSSHGNSGGGNGGSHGARCPPHSQQSDSGHCICDSGYSLASSGDACENDDGNGGGSGGGGGGGGGSSSSSGSSGSDGLSDGGTISVSADQTMCVTVDDPPDGGEEEDANGSQISLFSCDDSDEQYFTHMTDNTIRPYGDDSFCMNVWNGLQSTNPVKLYQCSAAVNEQFDFMPDGTIRPTQDHSLCLNINSGVGEGNYIQVYTCSAAVNEVFTITPDTGGGGYGYDGDDSGGSDPCQYQDDGECDVPEYCSSGDYNDCGNGGGSGIDPCQYHDDGECDVPEYCSSGDYNDCGSGDGGSCPANSHESGDGCECNSGYRVNSAGNGCEQGGSH
eukprot:SAG31_NODE_29_length_32663_cov_14.779695_16_plen_891_part_00